MMLFGEAFDKVARVVGLGYPGGPKVDKLAKEGEPKIALPKTHFEDESLDFSFSGIKTAVINLHHKNPDVNKADLCASFEKTITEELMENVEKAIKKTGVKVVTLAGRSISKQLYQKRIFKLRKKEYKSIYARLKTMYRQCSYDSIKWLL